VELVVDGDGGVAGSFILGFGGIGGVEGVVRLKSFALELLLGTGGVDEGDGGGLVGGEGSLLAEGIHFVLEGAQGLEARSLLVQLLLHRLLENPWRKAEYALMDLRGRGSRVLSVADFFVQFDGRERPLKGFPFCFLAKTFP
jgi:hypothetical protein